MAPTRLSVLAVLVVVGLSAGGCASRFKGEWAQTGSVEPDPTAALGDQRAIALKFIPPATIRYGSYDRNSGMVDPDTVQSDDYVTINGRSIAQFGVLTARIEEDELVVEGPGSRVRRLARVKDRTIFPPSARLPRLAADDQKNAGPRLGAEPAVAAVAGSAEWMESK
jgi:hypothetical protein